MNQTDRSWLWAAMVVGMMLAPGCKRAERSSGINSSSQVDTWHSAVALRSLTPRATVDTGHWADTSKSHDTTFYSRGRSVTTVQVFVDSTWFRVVLPSIIPGGAFGPFSGWDGTQFRANIVDWATLGYASDNADSLMKRIEYVQRSGRRMVIIPTGGTRARYMDTVLVNNLPVLRFSWVKWTAKLSTFAVLDTAAIGQAYDAGNISGISVMDEPFNLGVGGNAANGWNWPPGTNVNQAVDSLCRMTKRVFPARIPVGMFQHWSYPANYQSCDFITSQYGDRKGTVVAERDSALKVCRNNHLACAFAVNFLDGGIQAPRKRPDGTIKTNYEAGDCPLTTTGGRGTFFPNCRMTAAQVRDAGITLGKAGCFLTGFRYDQQMMADPKYQQVFRDIANALKVAPKLSCKRG